MQKSFILHIDSLTVLDELSDEQAGKFIKSIQKYLLDGDLPEVEQLVRIAVKPIISQIVRDSEKYAKKCERNRENAQKRWDAKGCESMRKYANGEIGKISHYDNKNDNKNDNYNYNDNYNNAGIPKNFAVEMAQIFYEENPDYPKNKNLDLRPACEIFDFLKSQGHGNDKIFNLWRQIASLRAENPFYKDKPLKIISSQIQGLYEAVMKPKEKNSKTKAFVNFTKIN